MAAQSTGGAATVRSAPRRKKFPKILAEYVETTRTCDTDMWRYRILLRSFWLRWADTPMEERFALVADEPPSLGKRWDAFVAGYAQELCCRYQIDPPGWVFQPEKYLDHFWFPTAPRRNRLLWAITSPAPWLQEHGVIVWDRELVLAQELIEGKGAVSSWRRNNMEPLTRQDMVECFEDIANRIRFKFVKGTIYLVGGAAVAMAYDDSRMSIDIDARIESAHGEIQRAILDIARERGWPTTWLNEQPVHYIPRGEDSSSVTVFYHSNLTVRAAAPRRLIAMKMIAGRERDINDIAVLLPYAKELRTVEDMMALLQRMLPDEEYPESTVRDTAEESLRRAGLL